MATGFNDRADTVAQGAAPIARAAPGAPDARTEELISPAIGIATQRDRCVAHDTREAISHRATRQEAAETVAAALRGYDQMAGGAGG